MRAHPGGLPPELVVRIVDAVAEALDYAHDRHLLHRDVKPSNILVTRGDPDQQRILLADFGIARRDDETDGLTATNMTVGTVAYAAPEQLMGKALDGRADQYALAATAFHLLTGAPPFQHSNPAVVISQHLTAAPPKLGQRRPELAQLDPAMSKALSKDPADRYARCIDFARALSHGIGTTAQTGADATRLSPSTPVHHAAADRNPPRSRRRARILVPAIVAALLVAAVAFAIGQFTGDREAASTRTPVTKPAASTSLPATTTTSAPPAAPPPPASPTTTTTTVVTDTVTEIETPTTTEAPTTPTAPTAVVGARCASPGATAHHGGGIDRILRQPAVHRSIPVVTERGRDPEPGGDDAARRPAALRGRIAGADLHAADRSQPAALRGGDTARKRTLTRAHRGRVKRFAVVRRLPRSSIAR